MPNPDRPQEQAPELEIRWMHRCSAYLDLLGAPSTQSPNYTPFTSSESEAMEAVFQGLTAEEQAATIVRNQSGPPPMNANEKPSTSTLDPAEGETVDPSTEVDDQGRALEADELLEMEERKMRAAELEEEEKLRERTLEELEEMEETDGLTNVNVGKDGLFEVNVKEMKLLPVFWELRDTLPVQRCLWFYDAHTPCPDELALELEETYKKAEPWKVSYQINIDSALVKARDTEAEFWHHMPRSEQLLTGSHVIFHTDDRAEVVADRASISSRLSQSLYSTIGGTYSGGRLVYRGYTAAVFARNPRPPQQVVEPAEGIEAPTLKEDGEAGEPPAEEVTDLVLIVHGIGQGLTATNESWNSLYDANSLRKLVQTQALNPKQAKMMNGRQIQFLPIQWRSSFQIAHDAVRATEDDTHGFHNRYSLEEVTLTKSIPWIREMANSVLIDVPFYMSSHRKAMIEAVAVEANRVYRKWVRRRPDFEQTGKVHLIGHSLGSALVADILSNQATIMPPLSVLPKQVVYKSKDRFLFNTRALFLVGSPLGLFCHLEQAQIIPRRGRERTRDVPADQALDRAGRYGCFSCDTVYNIFASADPIAYSLNATVDSALAKTKPPLQIQSVTSSLLASVYSSLPSVPIPHLPNPFGSSSSSHPEGDEEKKPPFISEIVVAHPDPPPPPAKSRAQKLFDHLNPHGAIDFYLQSEGSISAYIDMLAAHSSYWQDSDFASFILSEVFAKKEDLETQRSGDQ